MCPRPKNSNSLATRYTLHGSRPNLRQRDSNGRIVLTPPKVRTKVRARRGVSVFFFYIYTYTYELLLVASGQEMKKLSKLRVFKKKEETGKVTRHVTPIGPNESKATAVVLSTRYTCTTGRAATSPLPLTDALPSPLCHTVRPPWLTSAPPTLSHVQLLLRDFLLRQQPGEIMMLFYYCLLLFHVNLEPPCPKRKSASWYHITHQGTWYRVLVWSWGVGVHGVWGCTCNPRVVSRVMINKNGLVLSA